MKKTLLLVTIASVLASCSTTSWKDLFGDDSSEERNQELMESFGAEDEVFEKFTLSEPEPEKQPKPKEAKKTVVITEPRQSPQTKKPKKASKPEPSRTRKTKSSAEEPKNSKPAEKVLSRFPEEYPEEFKRMSQASDPLWATYKPIFVPGETIVMDINYMGISTGKIVLTTEDKAVIGGEEVYHAHARVKTSDYYSYLYELDDNIDSYISTDTFTPVKFSLIQRESGQDVDDLQLFDLDKLKTYSFYKRVSDGKTKKKKEEKFTPELFTDPLYVIWFLRGLPMDEGKVFYVPIMNRGKVIMLKAKNEGAETIKTDLGKRKAYKMKATTTYTGETLKSGDMTFWFSADEKRIFLKFEAKIKIGSISGDIEKYSR